MISAPTLGSIMKARVLGTPSPIAVGFELTHLCNLACAYCDRHTPLPDEMSLPQIIDALAGLRRIGMRSISLDGGEPLAHKHVADVVEWLVRHDIPVRMNTNGILVRKKSDVVRRLSKVKISVDGPSAVHDAVRGPRAFERAVDGAMTARALGVDVELTCVVGRHNAHALDELLDAVAAWEFGIMFQPARDSLFIESSDGTGTPYRLESDAVRAAFARIAQHKRAGARVLNGWASLRHFMGFPGDVAIPCAAGWINATMDPAGILYHCGQVSRSDKSASVVRLGAERAFAALHRQGCQQCWCARVVEENYAWGGRFDMSLPIASSAAPAPSPAAPGPIGPVVPPSSLVRRGR